VLASVVAIVWFSLRGRGGAVLKAKLHSLRGLPAAWRQRRDIQRQRRVPVRELRRMMARGWLAPYVRYQHFAQSMRTVSRHDRARSRP
jgi:hypothetical protein